MKPQATIRRALSDPNLLGATLAGDSWQAWRVLLIAAMGEALTQDERAIFSELTGGRHQEPNRRVEEFIGVIGRRGGKSRAIAVLATYIAALCEHSDSLVGGETGVVLIIAPDQRQALIVLEYINAAFAAVPMLSALVASRTVDTITLTTGISIEVRSASFRRLRGPTYLAAIADEAAFWYSEETANADT
jgi:phage terminase large subunit-like protein